MLIHNTTKKILSIFLSLILIIFSSYSSAALLIWPVQLQLNNDEKSIALWVENQGQSEQVLQARAFSWIQRNGEELLEKQNSLVISPPIIKIAPGKKQLIRVMNKTPAQPGKLLTYRIILDEIPKKSSIKKADESENLNQGIKFQFRYSLPLFIYGKGLSANAKDKLPSTEIAKNLSWKISNEDGKHWLSISNKNAYYVHLNFIKFSQNKIDTANDQSSSLSGYILPNATMKWELKESPQSKESLQAILNGLDAIIIMQ